VFGFGGAGGWPGAAVQHNHGAAAAAAPPALNRTNPPSLRYPPVALLQPAAQGADLWAWEVGPGPGPPDPFHDDWTHWRDSSGGGGGSGEDDDGRCGSTYASLKGEGRGSTNTGGNGRPGRK
jgi:hypothetical protein